MFRTLYEKEHKLWHGVRSRPIFNPDISLGEAVLKSMQVHGPKIAQISDDSGIQLTYDDMRERTIRAAVNLQMRGYKPGQVIGVSAKNSHNLAPVVFAAYCLGCPVNALATSFVKTEVVHMFTITKPSVVFCDVEEHEKMVESLQGCGIEAKIITMNGKIDGCEQVEDLLVETGLESTFRPTPLDGARTIGAILCSSGTTGLSKGVSLSHAALLTTQSNFELVQSTDILLNFSELFWITCVNTLLWGTLFGATRIITTQPFSPELTFRLIEKYKITFMLHTVNFMVAMLRHESIDKHDLTSLKNYCTRGNKPPRGLLTDLNKHFPDGRTYAFIGMTEMASLFGGACTRNKDTGTTGQLMCDVEAIVVDENENRCGPNTDGELCLKPRYPLLGYYNNPEATKEAFDADGFFKTGDIAHFDDVNDLYVVDRKKDIIRYCFHQISPTEIESVLMRSREIAKVCVASVPDHIAIDLPTAAIIREKNSTITKEEIYAMVADNLPDKYQLRGGIYFMESFATTASGKVLRRKVKEEMIKLYNALHHE